MNPEIEQLKKEMAELRQKVTALTSAQSIPFDIDRAFDARGFVKHTQIRSDIDPLSYDSLFLEVPVDGSGVGSMQVLEFPIRWMQITKGLAGGEDFLIPLYTLNNLGA